jgi:hypothetical protein
MKTYWGMKVEPQGFLILALDGDEWSASRHGRFIPREIALSHCILDRMLDGPQSRCGRCLEKKHLAILGIETGPSRPSLYGVSYHESNIIITSFAYLFTFRHCVFLPMFACNFSLILCYVCP